jgi:hypothetical protein
MTSSELAPRLSRITGEDALARAAYAVNGAKGDANEPTCTIK